MRSARSALLFGATALVGLGLILLLVSGTAMHGGAALGMLAAGWWGMGLVPVHVRTAPPEPAARRRAVPEPPGPPGAVRAPSDG
ncbi:hypothetical protein HUT16_24775 [Kitasatospora sp. NA04385]|uniref:hypothetical protein n=1 Tax=Kitasatospora sp. NA04385 TaxID=2742135 RepID=UPI0015927B71|nr:hypothetical protein [Kitasatospora sp. NA04385]QKW21842.1 hypothetical protein HUT16_24775 [Kitasatospora sp. NA04385]